MTDSRDTTPRTTVLGVGNSTMGDDGAGLAVLDALAEMSLPDWVELVKDETAGMHLIKHFRSSERVLFVDAIDCGAEPGSVFRFTPEQAGIHELRSNNIHGMGLSYLVTNARFLGSEPEVIVYGIQVGEITPDFDSELTGPVRVAVALVVEKIAAELA